MTGYKTTEFWLSAIGALVAVVFPLLVAYGVLDSEKGEMWAALILAVAGVVVPIVVGSIAKNYADNRTAVKLEAVSLEREAVALELLRLEALGNE
jgi:fucose permease